MKKSDQRFYLMLLIVFIGFWALTQTGCANFGKRMKSFLGGQPSAEVIAQAEQRKMVKFSENSQAGYKVPRRYKRMSQKKMEEESKLQSSAGSLWNNQGQGSYLFSQNIIRRPGDILNVKIEGAPQKQLETKVKVIQKLLERLDTQQRAQRRLASTASPSQAKPNDKKPQGSTEGGTDGSSDSAETATNSAQDENKDSQDENKLDVEYVPTRIVERMIDGNYRVKGSQTFMIGKREYRVIVTGIVREEDFNDEGLESSKLLDPKFDIVSLKKKGNVQL